MEAKAGSLLAHATGLIVQLAVTSKLPHRAVPRTTRASPWQG
jgi:hypothetical protein